MRRNRRTKVGLGSDVRQGDRHDAYNCKSAQPLPHLRGRKEPIGKSMRSRTSASGARKVKKSESCSLTRQKVILIILKRMVKISEIRVRGTCRVGEADVSDRLERDELRKPTYRVPSEAVPGSVEKDGENGNVVTSSASAVGAVTWANLKKEDRQREGLLARLKIERSDLHRGGIHQ